MKSMATNGMASSYFPPNFLLHMQQQQQPPSHDHDHHLPPPPPFLQEFTPSMLGKRPPMYGGGDDHHQQVLNGNRKEGEEEAVSDDDDDGSSQAAGAGEKKRRLSVEQVRTLEKNFELGNKLEPERKAQLARVLGLQPRQVAIWFQNRRARWKTKQLERDYDALRRQLDAVKADNDALLSHNKKLQAEIITLKGREAGSELINLNKETEASCSNRSENSSEINLDISRGTPATDSPMNPPQGGGMPFYSSIGRPTGVDIDQLLHNPTTTSILPKIELGNGNANVHSATTVSDTTPNFSNLLCGGVDEAPPFWPWADHQHFH